MIRLVPGDLYGTLSHLLKKKPQIEIDLREGGVSQDDFSQDEEKMKEINEKLERKNGIRHCRKVK